MLQSHISSSKTSYPADSTALLLSILFRQHSTTLESCLWQLLRGTRNISHKLRTFALKHPKEIIIKKDGTKQTVADRTVHRDLKKLLHSIVAIPIVSEEGRFPRSLPCTYWLIDPLDGTDNFLRGNGQYSCNITLVINRKAALSIIVTPELYEITAASILFPAITIRFDLDGKTFSWRRLSNIAPRRSYTSLFAGVSCRSMTTFDREFCSENFMMPVTRLGLGNKFRALMRQEIMAVAFDHQVATWDVSAADFILRTLGYVTFEYKTRKPINYSSTVVDGYVAHHPDLSLRLI